MSTDEIINKIAIPGTENWKCYDTLRNLLDINEEFKNVVVQGIASGKIKGFDAELWEKLGRQNMRAAGIDSFLDVLKEGYNQGYCTVASKQVSFSLDSCVICGGVLPILKGTTNCEDGSHTWIECLNYIIDTTLMLYIETDYKNKIGYIEENRYNPSLDSIYNAAKEFTNDTSLRKL